jgi:hypothetical protein
MLAVASWTVPRASRPLPHLPEHGNSIADLKAVANETEELLRAALQRWLRLKGSRKPDDVVKVIDESMFGASDPPS